jgi:hypothetical protein
VQRKRIAKCEVKEVKMTASKMWRLPADEKERSPSEQATKELLDRFIEYAVEVLERRGYVIVQHEWTMYENSPWDLDRIFVGRADLVELYMENRYGPLKKATDKQKQQDSRDLLSF